MQLVPHIFTVGHSTHSQESFFSLLQLHGIEALVDVRSAPYSRRFPHFNREQLRQDLAAAGMRYVFLGKELGGRGSSDSEFTDTGRINYGALATSQSFLEGLDRLQSGLRKMDVAIMCSERDPLMCHRGILIARCLSNFETTVDHIHANGRLESHQQAEQRLLTMAGLGEPEMFRPVGETLSEAYYRQESKIAFTRRDLNAREHRSA